MATCAVSLLSDESTGDHETSVFPVRNCRNEPMNTDSTPFFSVVIPTRNRAQMAADLVRSTLRQDFPSFEIVLVDNSENEETRQTMETFDDDRIRYVRTGALTMVDNWNRALGEAAGEYTMVIPDRHAFISRDRLSELHEVLKDGDKPVLTWRMQSADPETNQFWPLKGSGRMRHLSSRDFCKAVCRVDNHTYFTHLPRGMNSCIHRETLRRMADTFGCAALPDSPDFGLGFSMVYLGMDVVYWDTTITTNYAHSLSNGGGIRENADQRDAWIRQFPYLYEYMFEHAPFPVVTVENIVLNMFFYWSEQRGHPYRWSDIRKGKYYGRVYKDVMFCDNWELRDRIRSDWAERVARESLSVRLESFAKARRIDRRLKRQTRDEGSSDEGMAVGAKYGSIMEAVEAFE